MSAQVLANVKGKRKPFSNGKAKTYPINLLHVGVMLTIIKVSIMLFLLVRIKNILEVFEINQSSMLSGGCPGIFSSGRN